MPRSVENDSFGSFELPPSPTAPGRLRIAGEESCLYLHGASAFSDQGIQEAAIRGVLLDGTKVTLINCVTLSLRSDLSRETLPYEAVIFPNYVVTGDEHIDPSADDISEVVLTIDDAERLFYDFDAFGTSLKPEAVIAQIVQLNDLKREVRIGERPIIGYFTGRLQILQATTSAGTLYAQHNPRYNLGGPKGVSIENHITIHVRPPKPQAFHDALDTALRFLRFLELMVGRAQNIGEIVLNRGSEAQGSRVHWSHQPRRRTGGVGEERVPHPSDVLVSPILAPDKFVSILQAWMSSSSDRQSARDRAHSSFLMRNRYSIDRLVAAANVYDLLPNDATPRKVPIDGEVMKARDCARKLFLALPESYERASMLNAIGRIGTATLKHKTRHRATLLLAQNTRRLPSMIRVLETAVDCRNHFVHGSPSPIDFDKDKNALSFLTDSLEFVFLASELVDCGWSLEDFMRGGTVMSHPFSAYIINYPRAYERHVAPLYRKEATGEV